MSCLARRMPFSSGSTTRSLEIKPWTPLTSGMSRGCVMPARAIADSYSAFMEKILSFWQTKSILQTGQTVIPGSPILPHTGQRYTAFVCVPQSGHLLLNVTVPHCGHLRSPVSRWTRPSTCFAAGPPPKSWLLSLTQVFAAASTERRTPPFFPTGKSTCTGGFILRGADLPGRPIRPPIRVPALDRILMPDRCEAMTSPLVNSGRVSQVGSFFSSGDRPRPAIRASGIRIT